MSNRPSTHIVIKSGSPLSLNDNSASILIVSKITIKHKNISETVSYSLTFMILNGYLKRSELG